MRVYSAADFKRGSAVLPGFPGAGRAASSLIRKITYRNVYLPIRGHHETQGAGH